VEQTASRFFTVPEAAEFCRVSPWTIRAWLTEKTLTRYKAGGRTLVSKDEIAKLVAPEKPTQAAARNSKRERRRGR